jgi:hypothetical protein
VPKPATSFSTVMPSTTVCNPSYGFEAQGSAHFYPAELSTCTQTR